MTTPKLLADGLQEGEGGWLLFEFLENAVVGLGAIVAGLGAGRSLYVNVQSEKI